MPRKRRISIVEYVDGDQESAPAPRFQTHTQVKSGTTATSLSSTRMHYQLPPSPQKHQARRPPSPINWHDDLLMDGGSGHNDEEQTDPIESMLDPGYVSTARDETARPKKRAFLGDHPLLAWIPEIDNFIQEFLRLETCNAEINCASCHLTAECYQCVDCHDLRVFCGECMILKHSNNPFHCIQHWNGSFFQRISLKALGLQVKLGHAPDEQCINPAQTDFVVIDTNGIHSVCLAFCNCEKAQTRYIQLLRARLFPATIFEPQTAATFGVLKHFQMLSFTSKISAFEFYHSLARLTDNTGCNPPPDRYTAFLRIIREWRHVRLLKCMGRGHDPSGVSGTKEGECAVLCPACPQPDRNLPADWESVPNDRAWLYSLFLGQDANFRLKRLNVSSESNDPGLNQGFAYMVNEAKFKSYLNTYDAKIPDDVSTCNNHDALKSASMRGGKGTAASGVGAVDCIRHDMKRPVSVGDLQKGERYVNMDFFFLSTLQHNVPNIVVHSYDICCQWSKNIHKRYKSYPAWFTAPFWKLALTYLVPKFHLAAHKLDCQASYSFNFTQHVGRTDGEAPERGWAATNAVANSTKEMGPGSRRDTLDDHFGDYNWRKVSSMAVTFLRKVKDAVPQREMHREAFQQFTDAVSNDDIKEWTEAIERWEKDKDQPNPFYVELVALSEHKVRLQLAEEEATEIQENRTTMVHKDVSPAILIAQGIDLETQQSRLLYDIRQLTTSSTNLQRAKIIERKNVLRRKIEAWCDIQVLYMPEVASLRATEDEEGGGDPVESYNFNLMLPSQVISMRSNRTILKYEWRLRESQAYDLLTDIRRLLLLSTQLYNSKNQHIRGHHMMTRSIGLIGNVQERIKASAARYRRTRVALENLAPVLLMTEWENSLRPLLDSDIRPLTAAQAEGVTEGRRVVSWIWTTPGSGETTTGMHTALRLEWCKARARAHRWQEECELLKEEMRRVKASFHWEVNMWEGRAEAARLNKSNGQVAYACRQASIRKAMLEHCESVWVEAYKSLTADGVNK